MTLLEIEEQHNELFNLEEQEMSCSKWKSKRINNVEGDKTKRERAGHTHRVVQAATLIFIPRPPNLNRRRKQPGNDL